MKDDLPVLKSRPKGGGAIRTHWESPKTQRTMSLSQEAWEICGRLADDAEANRSEILEILLRYGENMELNLPLIRAKLVQLEQKKRKRA
jgi:hypothetical protein